MARRSGERWDALNADYRSRLEKSGITRDSYIGGADLKSARGDYRHQRELVRQYGPRNRQGDPEITASLLQKARREKGNPWVTQRLETMRKDYERSAKGKFPYQGQKPPMERSQRNQLYATRADIKTNPVYASFYWYRGVFG